MKKIITLFVLLFFVVVNMHATKTFATFETPAPNGSWDSESNVYTWTDASNNLMQIFSFSNGELADYTSLHLTTNSYVDIYRVCFMKGSSAVATIAFYSAGEKNLVFAERNETKDLDLSEITSIRFGGAAGSGSIGLDPSSVYMVKPFSLTFDNNGKAHITPSDLDVTGNVTIDPSTGVITSTGTGTFSVSLPNVDFSSVNRVDVTRSGDDICNTMAINDAVNGNLNTWYGSKYGCDFSSYQSKAEQVNKITWNVDKAGTMTLSDIVITSSVMNCSRAGEVSLNTIQYHNFSDGSNAYLTWNVRVSTDTYYGSGSSDASNYVDLTEYDEVRIYRDDNTGFRAFFINAAGSGTNNYTNDHSACSWNSENKYWKIDLSKVEKYDGKIYLNTIKSSAYGVNNIVNDIVAYKTPAAGAPGYILTGKGVKTEDVLAALSDPVATLIDATGLTGTGISLVSANPNCIFIADAGVLSNTENVMIGSTIANLALTDGKPFSVPAGATATTASYDRTFSAAYSTVCLPFAATFTGTAYEFGGNDGTTVTFTPVSGTTLEAGKAYLVSNDFAVTGGSGALAAPASSAFKGTYTAMTVPAGTYGFSGGEFKKVGANVTCKPFRAYLDLTSSAKALNVSFGETAINNIVDDLNNAENIYGVNGARQDGLQKGINIIKLSNGATRKVVIK